MNFTKIFGALCIIFIWTCLLPETTFAKESQWDQNLNEALTESETDRKLERLNALLSESIDPEQKIILNYYIGQTYSETSHFGSAIPPLNTALSLNDTHTPDHYKRRNAISTLLQSAYFKAGRTREGMAIANETVELNDVLIKDTWSRNETSIIHRLSALECPHHIGSLSRTEAHSFDTYARDIGCSYKEYRDEDNLLTVYFTNYEDESLTPDTAHASATRMMTNAGSSKNAKRVYGEKAFDFESPSVPNVLGSLFLRSEGQQYTGTWTAIIDNWVLKTRVTWDASLGENYGEQASRNVFAQTPNQTSKQIKACKTASWPEDSEVTQGNGMDIVLMEAFATPSERPSLECILRFSNKGNAFISGHLDGPRLYTIAGSALEDDIFVEAGNSVNGLSSGDLTQDFVLKSRRAATNGQKASTTLYKAYKAKPSPDQVFRDFIDVYSGKTQSYGRVEYSENGENNIILNKVEDNPDISSKTPKE